ncbi:hypothetical protein D3C75_897490 [compost metagenome]
MCQGNAKQRLNHTVGIKSKGIFTQTAFQQGLLKRSCIAVHQHAFQNIKSQIQFPIRRGSNYIVQTQISFVVGRFCFQNRIIRYQLRHSGRLL